MDSEVFVKSDVSPSSGATITPSPHHDAHIDTAPSTVAGFLERVLVHSRTNDDKRSRCLVIWSLGHHNADTLMQDGNVRDNDSWKYNSAHSSDAKEGALKGAMSKMKNAKPKVQGCLSCEQEDNVDLGWKNTV